MKSKFSDIIIIGGGASGIICGIKAAEINSNRKITILEKQPKIAKKLLATGNGRCNFTNINANKSNYHGSFSKYVDFIFSKYSPENVIEIFNSYGLESKVESEGRVYPYSNHASSVVDILRYRLEKSGVEIACDTEVIDVKKENNNFIIKTNNGIYSAKKVVFTTGTTAGTKDKSGNSGINILQKMGHTITPMSPALCSVLVHSNVLPSIKGIRSTGKVTLLHNNKPVKDELGEIQFTDKALSGICVFNLATYIKDKAENYSIKVSLLPNFSDKDLKKMMFNRVEIFKDRPCEDLFTGLFHKKLGLALLKECNIKPLSKKIKSLTDKEINALIDIINNWNFKVKSLADFSNAQVVSGGVSGDEINPNTMESKKVKNLYVCGETIDIDGDCGGYNLQFAFASGLTAGENL